MSADRDPRMTPEIVAMFDRLNLERQVVSGERCECGGSLDTGYVCLDCQRDYGGVAFGLSNDRWRMLAAGT